MHPLLIPAIAVAGLAGAATLVASKRKSGMTPERERIYMNALQNLKEPEKLRALATAFEKEGLQKEADLLFKRAGLRELPNEVKAARRVVFKNAMSSMNGEEVRKVASAFRTQGAIGAAAALEEYADGLGK